MAYADDISIQAVLGGSSVAVSDGVDSSGNPVYNLNGSDGGATLTGTIATYSDPGISYGFSVDNNTNVAETFSVVFTGPFVGGPYTIGDSSSSGTVTGVAGNTVTIAPINTYMDIASASGAGVFDQIVGGCSMTLTSSVSENCYQQNDDGIAILTAASGTMSITVSGSVSANTDFAITGLNFITGTSANNPTPEPATWSMLAGGLLIGLGAKLKRGRR